MQEEVAALLARRFIARKDVKAVMRVDGAYMPDRSPWTMGDLRAHVAGEATYGHYLLSQESTVKLFAFDIDLRKTGVYLDDNETDHKINPREVWASGPTGHPAYPTLLRELRCIAEGLAARAMRMFDIPVAVAYSGSKGMHVYGFTGEVPAAQAREAATVLMNSWGTFQPTKGSNFWQYDNGDPEMGYPNVEIEVFPKQDSLDGKDLGNLMRLPLGVHRKSGAHGFFVDLKRPVDELQPMDPYTALTAGDPWA